ncbi:MAG: PadR family transcriptional regulator [Candidatus Krumholzibacteria bacterium]|jgi:DNA-binding PadR family transcriptional regulator|nr:PadR family transcriptional regulator [Candidatus Krumholzibacteria bacterium]MDP6796531.1 PadR family transcriptional regulator [Candidatus Krumholzibacteria bacterium]MDP7022607.1 PadR family transcriptional regulator [Candidatus Krumholzibacteria bacterium]
MSKVDLVLLGLLKEKPRHGYDILQEVRQRDMKNWVGVSAPAIYKGLERLEEQTFLSAKEETGSSRPDRRVYTISAKGEEQFRKLLHQSLEETKHPFFRLLIAFGFAHLADKGDLLDSLARRRNSLLDSSQEIRDLSKRMQENPGVPLHAGEIIGYYRDLVKMEIQWLDRAKEMLESVDQWPEGVLGTCEKD